MFSLELTVHPAVLQKAGDRILSRDASHIASSGNLPGEGAADDAAAVASGNAAHLRPCSPGMNLRLHVQLPHLGGCRQIPEQALAGTVRSNAKAPDGMSVSFKAAAENGNSLKFRAFQIQIRLQRHLQSLAVAVQTAFFRKPEKILPG